MAVKFDKNYGEYRATYDDMSNEYIIDGYQNLNEREEEFDGLEEELKRAELEVQRLRCEVDDKKRELMKFRAVTEVINGVPIYEKLENRYVFHDLNAHFGVRKLTAWENAHMSNEERENTEYKWCFSLENELDDSSMLFLASNTEIMGSENGFSISMLRSIAIDFVVNHHSAYEIKEKMKCYLKKSRRIDILEDLLS